jgi:hypothetical protein
MELAEVYNGPESFRTASIIQIMPSVSCPQYRSSCPRTLQR